MWDWLLNLGAVNSDGQVRRVHAVLVCPQLGAGVLTISETVDSSVVNGQGVGGVVVVADLDSRLARSAVFAVIEDAVVYDKVGGGADATAPP